jgi:hypothetical protein
MGETYCFVYMLLCYRPHDVFTFFLVSTNTHTIWLLKHGESVFPVVEDERQEVVSANVFYRLKQGARRRGNTYDGCN